MTQTDTIHNNNNLANLFVFDNPDGDEQQAFLEEVGTIVFQSALMQFIFLNDKASVEEFDKFLNDNVGSDSFMEILCTEYPNFEKILRDEMIAFQTEKII
jgi:hypothetical protein